MPSRDWRLRIQDIVQSIAAIRQRTAGMTFEQFQGNETIAKAVLYDFIIIGEAAINVPSDIQSRYPDIPWRIMGDMRNVMAHEYFQVTLRIVWNTIENDLPSLMQQLEEVIEHEGIGE
ncbi:HepT-like ribonuclease domain-containing protein [Brasilonema bromeliae]|uniref:DUF86 domain-containing protein n=1 Tax=Brasilonema bromeliae SPC951 TaxID=385972 RepID=A0ABX1P7I7_9CYAN|nr:hypothetical protein [Brasilonema bromeliae SPC951]